MQEAGYGRIVLVSSIAAEKGSMWQANYAAAKAGLVGLARSVAREHGRDGITVNIVLPGPTADSDMNALTPPEVSERLRQLIPLKRLARADDTAHAVAFLLDERSAYLTGVVLPVDGGFTL
jgi:3-oxoacyl-[acyl-carrier protein] reductase